MQNEQRDPFSTQPTQISLWAPPATWLHTRRLSPIRNARTRKSAGSGRRLLQCVRLKYYWQ